MFHDDDILYDELREQRSRDGGSNLKRLRLPLHAPGRRPEERTEAEAKDDQDTSDRGVRVLDMSQGYSVVE